MAFEKATNFEPRIIMKQSINSRKIHEVNHIDVGQEDEIEINEAHIKNPNYKGKNYDPNFTQNRLKTNNSTNNTSNNHNNNTRSSYGSSGQCNSNNSGYGYSTSNQQEKPVNVSVTLHRPVSKDQLYVVPPQSWGDWSDTKHSKCLLLGGRRLNQLTLIPKPKGSGGARAATAQVGPANIRNDTKRCLPVEASLRPGEAVPW